MADGTPDDLPTDSQGQLLASPGHAKPPGEYLPVDGPEFCPKREGDGNADACAFESLLTHLSLKFVNVPSDQVDAEIEDAQRRMCEFLGLDVSSLWQWSDQDTDELILTHLYRPSHVPQPPDRMEASKSFPWCFSQLKAGKILPVSSTEAVPTEAARDRESWRHFGIRTSLGLPLSTGAGPVIGVLSFNTTRTERQWPEDTVRRLAVLAQIFANALARKRSDEALRESQARLRLAIDAAEAGLWAIEPAQGGAWVSDRAKELFQFDADQPVSYRDIIERIHPEDRAGVIEEVREAMESGQKRQVEYRLALEDGRIRWIASRGCVRTGPDGIRRLTGVSVDITERKATELHLREACAEIKALKERIQAENLHLRDEIQVVGGYGDIVGSSDAVRTMMTQGRQVAVTNSTALILGETGTGKELLARHIHAVSQRKDKPFVATNLGAMPGTLIENELFGREKGAFTGALARQAGRFEIAHQGTIFLDEIGEMPLESQVKILRVLQTGELERLGSSTTMKVDVRVIAATNRDLEQLVHEGRFRQDLFYRLNVFPITVPPLRERKADIPQLVWSFVKEFAERMGKPIERIPKQGMARLQDHSWPGNIRELRNVIERSMILSQGPELNVVLPGAEARAPEGAVAAPNCLDLQSLECQHIRRVLEMTKGRIRGKGGAAELLGLKPTTLYSRMQKLGITRP